MYLPCVCINEFPDMLFVSLDDLDDVCIEQVVVSGSLTYMDGLIFMYLLVCYIEVYA